MVAEAQGPDLQRKKLQLCLLTRMTELPETGMHLAGRGKGDVLVHPAGSVKDHSSSSQALERRVGCWAGG